MSIEILNPLPQPPQDIAKVRAEITLLETEITNLEARNTQSFLPLQLLSRWLGIGYAKQIDWAQFKLKLMKKEIITKDTN